MKDASLYCKQTKKLIVALKWTMYLLNVKEMKFTLDDYINSKSFTLSLCGFLNSVTGDL